MEHSQVVKIVRWRLALQEFDFLVRHIPGKDQVVADYFSRTHLCAIYSLVQHPSDLLDSVEPTC